MLTELDNYDWQEAFGYAGEPETHGSVNISAVPGELQHDDFLTPITREDVVELGAMSEGENDEQSWMCYGRVLDGRWFYLEAWCDYTGWDCQAGGSVTFAATREECERFALTDEARQRMNVSLPA